MFTCLEPAEKDTPAGGLDDDDVWGDVDDVSVKLKFIYAN